MAARDRPKVVHTRKLFAARQGWTIKAFDDGTVQLTVCEATSHDTWHCAKLGLGQEASEDLVRELLAAKREAAEDGG